MFKVDKQTKQIKITRGDIGTLEITTTNADGSQYEFQKGDVVRFKVFKKRNCGCVELQKDVVVEVASLSTDMPLTSDETKIGDLINKPVTYWYEVELNPETNCQTIIGFDDKGEKEFVLYPEGDEK